MLEDVPSWYFCVVTSQQGNTGRDAARGSSLSAPAVIAAHHRPSEQVFGVSQHPRASAREIANMDAELASLS